MLPAPAKMAAPPRLKSRGSWSPAVPPPPVAGAPTGTGLADRRGVADGVADGDADGLALRLGVVDPAVVLGERLAVAESLAPGENEGGVADGEDAEQAATEAEASMAQVTQLAAVSLALSPVPTLVSCILMGSPHASGSWRSVSRGTCKWPAHNWNIRGGRRHWAMGSGDG